MPFTTQPQLTYGTTYHLVFEQLTPNVGKVSVNDLHDWTPPPDGLVIFPLQKSKLASIRYENNAWRVMPGYIPIYELAYTDGVAKGQSWMDGGRGCFQNIGGGNVARQSFTMYDRAAATVYGVYFAFFRTGSVGPVTISLTNSGGTRPLDGHHRRRPGEHLHAGRQRARALALRPDRPHHLRHRRHLLREVPGGGRLHAQRHAEHGRLLLRLRQQMPASTQPWRPVQHQRRGKLDLVADAGRPGTATG